MESGGKRGGLTEGYSLGSGACAEGCLLIC